jgi:membrane-bound metal-dependent hydrolase YbcI (DUF457 family)
MQGKNHVALALAVPLAGAMIAPEAAFVPASVWAWGGLVIGSLAPDMDGEGSIAYWGNWLPRYITPRPVRDLLNWVGQTTSRIIRAIFGHRNALHWPMVGLLLAVAGSRLGLDWLLWLGVGYVLHILGDSLTKSGVPLLGPVWRQDISFTPMVTGSFVESAFGLVLWAFVGWRFLALLPYLQSAWMWQLFYTFAPQFLPR